MVLPQLLKANVLVTGGTRGLGKAIGLEFARSGANVFLTHRWGSVDEGELADEFRAEGVSAPTVVESDASDEEATRALMTTIKRQAGRLDAIISGVAFAKVTHGLADLKKSALDLSLSYSAWPVVQLVQASQEVLGRYPRYVIAISSDGGQVCHEGYDLAGVAKSALETLCRYLALRLKSEGVRVNVVRPGFLDTVSARETFGDDTMEVLGRRSDGFLLDVKSVAKVCVALCSGLMDSVTGQVLTVDEGWSLVSPLAYVAGRGLPGAFPKDGDVA
jgi:NAD(P)-dependent dehydrogenase (short-subunit alcohol dehydrogenase family)